MKSDLRTMTTWKLVSHRCWDLVHCTAALPRLECKEKLFHLSWPGMHLEERL